MNIDEAINTLERIRDDVDTYTQHYATLHIDYETRTGDEPGASKLARGTCRALLQLSDAPYTLGEARMPSITVPDPRRPERTCVQIPDFAYFPSDIAALRAVVHELSHYAGVAAYNFLYQPPLERMLFGPDWTYCAEELTTELVRISLFREAGLPYFDDLLFYNYHAAKAILGEKKREPAMFASIADRVAPRVDILGPRVIPVLSNYVLQAAS